MMVTRPRSFSNPLRVIALAVFSLGSAAPAFADGIDQLEEQQRRSEESDKVQDMLEEAMKSVDRMRSLLDRMTRTKELKCLKAFGHDRFCQCIARRSPVGVSFEQYVLAVAASRQELGYDELTGDTKALVDGSRRAREECILTLRQ